MAQQRKDTQNKSKRRVTFATKQKVKPIPPLSSFSTQELQSIWYSRSEIETVTHLANELIVEAEDNITFGQTEYKGDSIRGLERKTEDGHAEAFLSRVSVYDAVLDEQDRQWNRGATVGFLDFDKIGQLCEKASSEAKFAAYQRGKNDQTSIQAYVRAVPTTTTEATKKGSSTTTTSVATVPKKVKKLVTRTKSACNPRMLQKATPAVAKVPLVASAAVTPAPIKKKLSSTARPAPVNRRASKLDDLLQKEKAQQSRNVRDRDAADTGSLQQQQEPELDVMDLFSNPLTAAASGNKKTNNNDESWITSSTASLSSWDTLEDDGSKSSQDNSVATASTTGSSLLRHIGGGSKRIPASAVPRPASKGKRGVPPRRSSTFKRTTEMLKLEQEQQSDCGSVLSAPANMNSSTSSPLCKDSNQTITPKSRFPNQGLRVARITKVAASKKIIANTATKKRVGRSLSLAGPIIRAQIMSEMGDGAGQ